LLAHPCLFSAQFNVTHCLHLYVLFEQINDDDDDDYDDDDDHNDDSRWTLFLQT